MSSRKPLSEDDLDHLVRRTLQNQAGSAQPPAHVWQQIRAGLEEEKVPPRRFRVIGWSALAMQAAIILLLITAGTYSRALPWLPNYLPWGSGQSSGATSDLSEQVIFSPGFFSTDIGQLRSMKTGSLSSIYPPTPARATTTTAESLPVTSGGLRSDEAQLRLMKAVVSFESSAPLTGDSQSLDRVQ